MTEIVVIRHAPADTGGRLAGRRDVPALLPDPARLATLRGALGPAGTLISSPALRCRQTAAALLPGLAFTTDPRLWEQDFGDWEGADPADLPDLGPLPRSELARHRPPRGESFADLCARLRPALADCAGRPGPVVLIAHAGIARAALSLALASEGAGLAFEIAPLSFTRIRLLPDGQIAIGCVNQLPA